MSHSDRGSSHPAPASSSSRPLWLAVTALLLVAIVVPLLVPLYDRVEPTLLGFPFFFWFQFLLIPVASLLTFTAFKLSERATSRDRRRRGFGSPTTREGGESR